MKRTKQNKLLALLLAITMVVTMLPTVVFAEDGSATGENIYPVEQIDSGELKNLYVGDVALIENGTLTSNTVQGVSYSDKVLYLENAEISGDHSFETEPDKIKTTAIYADGPLTLCLSGNSHIGNSSDTSLNFSVYSTEELTITGTGNLSVSGAIDAFSAKTICVENTGKLDINCASSGLIARDGNFSLQDSSVTILTTSTGWGTAIVTTSGNFSMESGSLTIDMPKGNGGYYTYGLYINGDVTISGGTVDIEAQQDSIYCKGNCTILSGNITAPDGIRAQSSGILTMKNGFVSVGGKGIEGAGGVYILGGKIVFSGNKIISSNVIFVDAVNFELEGKDRLDLAGGSFVLNQLGNISYQLWCEKDTSENVSKRIAFIGGDMSSEDQISFFTGSSGKKTYVKGCIADTKGGAIPVNTQITAKEFSSPVKAGYIFGGWYDNESFTGEAVTTPEAGKTYYAKWIEKIPDGTKDDPWDVSADGEGNNVIAYLEQNNEDNENPTYTLTISGSGAMKDYGKAADVPWNAYLNSHITAGVVEEGVTHLGARAFVLAKNLGSVTLPKSLESIGVSAFNQSSLTSVTLPNGLKEIGDYAFYQSALSGEINIPESVTTIRDHAFNQSQITGVTLPSGLTYLGGGAFNGTKLTSMPEIPLGITSLSTVFQNCTGITEIEIPAHVTTLDRTFMGCTGLTTVTIPETVESYVGVFNGCTGLISAVIESKADNIGGSNTSIASGVFGGCTNLKTVSVPKWVKVIGIAAFRDCSSLETTDFIEQATTIKQQAFQGCTSLRGSLNLSASTIESLAFDKCLNLGDNISVANTKSIGSNAFRDCSGINGIVYAQVISGGANNFNSKSVTALLNGGTFSVGEDLTADTLATPAKDGYAFMGWYDNADFTGKAVTTPDAGKTYYAKWAEKADQSITYENTATEKHINEGAFTNELTKTTVDGAITYTSSDETVATVNETTGEVTIVGAGTATITATAAGTDTHNEASASYTLTVTDHSFTKYVYNDDATYDADGTETAKCDFCNETDTKTAENTKLVDTTAPEGKIKVKENSFKSFINTITFGIFCKDKYDVTITAEDNETGVKSVEYLLSNTAISETDIANQTGWITYSAFSLENEGKYIIYVKITDNSGNVTYISSDGLVIDKTAPAVSGIENDKTYCSAVEVTVSDEYLKEVTVNGTAATVKDGKFTVEPAEGVQTIVVTDKAGNETTYTITVNDGHTFTNYVSNNDATCTEDGTKTAQCDFCDAKDTIADEGSKTGHSWNATIYAWSEDGSSCTATRICKTNASHKEEVKATITSEQTKAPTCTEKGETTYTATFVADWASEQTKTVADIPAAGHSYVKHNEVPATHKADGVAEHYTCENCDLLFDAEKQETTKEALVIAMLGHDFGDEWKSNAEKHWHECECGEKSSEIAHTFEWIIDKEATATEAGSKHEECSVCGYKKAAVEIPATGTPGGDGSNPSEPSKPDTDAPQTGDTSNMWLWIALLFVSTAGVSTTLVVSKKRRCHAKHTKQ